MGSKEKHDRFCFEETGCSFKGGVRGQRTEVAFRLLRWAQTIFSSAARWFARRGQKTTSSAASYFEPRTLCSGVEGPGCLSILNFEQLTSSCNLEVKLEASSLLFSPFACCKLFRSKILHVPLCFSTVLLTNFSVRLHTCLTSC